MLVGRLSLVCGGTLGPDSAMNKTFSLPQYSRQLTAGRIPLETAMPVNLQQSPGLVLRQTLICGTVHTRSS